MSVTHNLNPVPPSWKKEHVDSKLSDQRRQARDKERKRIFLKKKNQKEL
jgi:hypothetical protein